MSTAVLPSAYAFTAQKLVTLMEASVNGNIINLGYYATEERIEAKLKIFRDFWKQTDITGFTYEPTAKTITIWRD
jgi:hypothetical protein